VFSALILVSSGIFVSRRLALLLLMVFSVVVTAATPVLAAAPSAPTGVTATAGIGQATVSWTAVAGASSYTVTTSPTSSPDARSCTSLTTSCIVTGLASVTAYTFTVTATYSSETSPPSAASPSVTTEAGLKVVALGDSVMSGFGYFADSRSGTFYTPPQMSLADLPNCRPLFFVDSAPQIGANSSCSANVTTADRTTPTPPDVPWAPDYGYWNQVAWSSQFAKAVNAALPSAQPTDANVAASFRNFGISGATAVNWASDQITFRKAGDNTIYEGLDGVIKEYPDIITVTLGANPTLSQVLFGEGNACRFVSDFYTCFRDLIIFNQTGSGLTTIYTELLDETDAKGSTIIVTLYPTIIPAVTLFTAEQLMIAVEALNDVIEESVDAARVAEPDEASRLLVTSPVFNSGLPPGGYSEYAPCFGRAALGLVGTDGPSNQSTATQAVFSVTRGLTGWCGGTAYIISGDSGIHPNATGYGVMAAAAKATFDARTTATTPSLGAASPPSSVDVNTSYGPFRFTATGTPAPFFSLKEGALPPGMQLSSGGYLGGTPSAIGTYSFKVLASNGVSATSAETPTLQIQVRAAPSPDQPGAPVSSSPVAAPITVVTPTVPAAPSKEPVPTVDALLMAIESSPTSVSATQLAALNPAQIAALSSSVLRQIPAAAFRGMTTAQVQRLTDSQVGALRPSQVRALRPVTLRAMHPDEIRRLRPEAVANLRPEQLRLLRPKQLRALTARQVKALKPAQVTQLARESRDQLLRR